MLVKNRNFIIVCLLMLAVGCKDSPTKSNNDKNSTSNLLSELKITESDGYNTVITFEYNDDMLPTLIKQVDSTTNEVDNEEELIIRYDYDQTGQIKGITVNDSYEQENNIFTITYPTADKIIETDDEGSYYEYIFNVDNKVVKKNHYSSSSDLFSYNDFTWVGTNITKSEMVLNYDGNKSVETHWQQKINSIISNRSKRNPFKKKYYKRNGDGIQSTLVYTSSFEYDDKKNPFYELCKQIKLPLFLTSTYFMTTNNLIKEIIIVQIDDLKYEDTYSYVYNDSGFPVSASITEIESQIDGSNEETYSIKLEFTYLDK